jgi:hypothetical protein
MINVNPEVLTLIIRAAVPSIDNLNFSRLLLISNK